MGVRQKCLTERTEHRRDRPDLFLDATRVMAISAPCIRHLLGYSSTSVISTAGKPGKSYTIHRSSSVFETGRSIASDRAVFVSSVYSLTLIDQMGIS